MFISVDMDEFAIALVTSTKTRTGATPLRAVTKISPRMPTSFAAVGPDEGERGAQNERDENLPDERAVNVGSANRKTRLRQLGHDGKLLCVMVGVRERASDAPARPSLLRS